MTVDPAMMKYPRAVDKNGSRESLEGILAPSDADQMYPMSVPKIFSGAPLADILPLLISRFSKIRKPGSNRVPVEGFVTQQAIKDEGSLESFRMRAVGAVEHVFLSTGQGCNELLVVGEQSMWHPGNMLTNQFLDSSKVAVK